MAPKNSSATANSQVDKAASAPAAKSSISPEKKKALDAIMQKIEKDHGKGAIMRLGDATNMRVETIPSGALPLDLALGGGLPKGRVIEVYGPESSGKTTLVLHAIAEVQKRGGVAAFVDAEHALDPTYAAAVGVDINNLLISQPDSGEMALEIVDNLVRSMAVDIIAIDSVAALVPRAEIEGEMGASHVGLQARLMSQALRKITANVGRSNCIVIFLNQLRQKIGVSYGSPETTTGGTALKFYASVRLDIRRIQTLKKGTEEYGIRAKVKVAKNKVAPPFRIAEFDIIFGKGISTLGCLVDLAEEMNIIVRKGAWYSYQGDNIGQGRDNTIKYMEDKPEFAQDVERQVREKLSAGVAVSATKVLPEEIEPEDEDALPDDF
jgi:recombination protein RecA